MTIRFGSVRGPTSMGVKRSLVVSSGRSCMRHSPSSRGCERHDTSYCGDAASQGEIDELLWNIKTVIQKTSLSRPRSIRLSTESSRLTAPDELIVPTLRVVLLRPPQRKPRRARG